MTLQYIQDKDGKTTGVIIPIKEWQSLKAKYSELEEEVENPAELASWQEKIIDERLTDYYSDPHHLSDFDKTLEDIERDL